MAVVREQFVSGVRVDLTVVARELGLGRATIYRWFGSRDGVLGEVIAAELDELIAHQRRRVRKRGVHGLLEVFDRINRSLARSTALRSFVEQERDSAMRLLTSSDGVVQPLAVSRITELITDEVASGRYDSPAEPATLAYAVVRLAEAFLYSDAAFGMRGDHAQLREVEAALLGASRAVLRPAGPQARRRLRIPDRSA